MGGRGELKRNLWLLDVVEREFRCTWIPLTNPNNKIDRDWTGLDRGQRLVSIKTRSVRRQGV